MFENSNSFAKTAALWATFAAAGMGVVGCRSEAEIARDEAARVAAAVAKQEAEQKEHDRQVNILVENGATLVHETAYVVTLKMAKSEFTLDPFTHIGNELKAQYRDILVGEKEYNERHVGETVSSKGDFVGFLTKGDFASYDVSVSEKRAIDYFRYVDASGTSHDVPADVFRDGIEALKAQGKVLYAAHSSGTEAWLVNDREISASDIAHIAPLNRYFAQLKISNSSFSLSLSKHLRNATTEHTIEIEIPEKVYLSKSAAFDGKMSDSFLVSGHLSSLTGTIESKRAERDNGSVKVTLKDGRVIPMLKSELPQ